MNLKQRIVSTIAAGTLLFGATSGLALAADSTSTADTVVNVTCPVTSTVEVNVNGSFDVDTGAGETSATLPGGFEVVLDLTCNWNPLFLVSAGIGTFNYDGTAPAGMASSFPGGRLTLTNGTGSYAGITNGNLANGPLAGPPNVIGTVFPGNSSTSGPVIIPSTVFIIFPYAAPGVTTATWDGSLTNLPVNLAGGTYTAPLTVTLSVA
jgi:hypothetical protein